MKANTIRIYLLIMAELWLNYFILFILKNLTKHVMLDHLFIIDMSADAVVKWSFTTIH